MAFIMCCITMNQRTKTWSDGVSKSAIHDFSSVRRFLGDHLVCQFQERAKRSFFLREAPPLLQARALKRA